MSWKLFLDDVREPPKGNKDSEYVVARTSDEAIYLIYKKKTFPSFMSLDHDLGENDDTMDFLKELYELWTIWGNKKDEIPDYQVHSTNSTGAKNIISYIESWKGSVNE